MRLRETKGLARHFREASAAGKKRMRKRPPTWDLHPCFICGHVRCSPDKKPPWRCYECFAAVAANEADGEL